MMFGLWVLPGRLSGMQRDKGQELAAHGKL